jgi:tripartite-type tricarboxylate transporter receptor subunit TctC
MTFIQKTAPLKQLRRNFMKLTSTCVLALMALPSVAQTGTVKMIVTNPPGGSADIMARLISQQLGVIWKKTVVIENKSGAAGAIGMTYAAAQAPDGSSLLFGAQGATIVAPLLGKVSYDMARDFVPVSLVATGPSVLMVAGESPYKTAQDMIQEARTKPGAINFGSGGNGTAAHLGAEMLNNQAKIKTTHIPYKGGIAAINDLAANQIQFVFTDVAPIVSFVKSGKLRALAVTSAQRQPLLPEVPTFVESGLPNFIASNSWGIYLPAGASLALVEQLTADIKKAMTDPALVKRFSDLGFEARYSTAAEFRSYLAEESGRLAKLIKENNIKVE